MPGKPLAVDDHSSRVNFGFMFARVFLFLMLTVGLLVGGSLPMQECAKQMCGCCDGAKRCCVVSERTKSQVPISNAQAPSLNLKIALVPLVELFPGPFSQAPRFVPIASAKPTHIYSSACIELTCVRLI